MRELWDVARKELYGFFASPVAWLFLGAFLLVTFFVFFWVETFFARNVADLRPLFQWMPVLLIFLVAALTMRAWSEERRAGTLEALLTAPVQPVKLVLGKFLGGMALVAVALALTLPLPVTVALLGPLDWGPVIGGYVAALLLAAAYLAIGLFVSARTDNPIVSLIGTVVLGGALYVIGSDWFLGLAGPVLSPLLAALGTGARFESITRGVLDLRDLYYYLSLVGIFLTLNVYSLERLRWAPDARGVRHRRWHGLTGLVLANFALANLWLAPLGNLRIDLTEGRIYTLSEATRQVLSTLREPLVIHAYFSRETHPLLAPLVPQLHDLLKEYVVAGGGRVRLEFVDPAEDPEAEREAGERFGVRPVAFQTATKYQTALVNAYFDIVVQYGDEYERLSYRDLIEIKVVSETDLEVRLRNPEYDITRAIRKVVQAWRGGGDVFAELREPVTLHLYLSAPERLPEPLRPAREAFLAAGEALAGRSGGRLKLDVVDPDAAGAALQQELAERYGLQPLVLGLLDPDPFWLYAVLESGDRFVLVNLPEKLEQEPMEKAILAGLKRFVPGVLRTIAVVTPPGGMHAGRSYTLLEDVLRENAAVRNTTLADGTVPEGADLLLVLDPHGLDEKQVFAIDQFLMEGGTVLVAGNPVEVNLSGGAITASVSPMGLEDWLAHQGVRVDEAMVMDPQNLPFPIPVTRFVGGFAIQEIQALPYPYFIDVRGEGLGEHVATAGLEQVVVTWASPLTVEAAEGVQTEVLLRSSPQSWTSDSVRIQPDFAAYPETGFAPGEADGPHTLAVALTGRFTSFFKGKPSPLAPPPQPRRN
jgi:ABC-2 type transport system permease protein